MKKSVLEYIREAAARFGERTAIVDGDRQMTFNQIMEKAGCLGAYIQDSAGQFKKPVAVLLPKCMESILAFAGVLCSGNFYVPLDIKLPDTRLRTILDDLAPLLVITLSGQMERLERLGVHAAQILCLDVMEPDGAYPSDTDDYSYERLIDTDPAYIIYTSGSTGAPKGVVISHRGIIDYIEWAVSCFRVDDTTVIGSQSPFYFDNSTLDIYLCFAAGATLVIIPEHYFMFPVKLMEYVNARRINFIFWVPSVLIQVANTHSLDSISGCTLSKVLFAGEVMPNKPLNYWRRMLPHTLFANLYGPTEITVDCTCYIVDRDFEDHDPLPIGKARGNVEILVLNKDDRQVVEYETGELCVRGSCVGFGYWNHFEKTGSVFVQNPLNAHYPEIIYRTGDLVYFNEREELIFVGRKDSQIKHMGYRIELGDVENAFGRIAGITGACVLYDEKRREILAFYTSDRLVEDREMRLELLAVLPKYMIPSRYIRLTGFPLNANGKIDRRSLMEAINEVGFQQ